PCPLPCPTSALTIHTDQHTTINIDHHENQQQHVSAKKDTTPLISADGTVEDQGGTPETKITAFDS
ncbi:hypothetical protein ABGB18_42765, partial [Nonomuraea sp. B12E4]|uniref:hypothetical protein n=1 Tax=Nonomuraea sp. B12E4 TaxID=3153564 RepID=UPI00325D9ECF